MGSNGCYGGGDATDVADNEAVGRQQAQYRSVQPVPFYEYSNELDIYKQIYDARVENVITTHTVIRSNTGMIIDDFPSLGFPIPYDVQLTNPLKAVDMPGADEGGVVIEMPEPNGLYSSKTTAATWCLRVLKVGNSTIVTPVYYEDKVSCYPFPVIVDRVAGTITPLPDAIPGLKISTDKLKGLQG
jgi:hypothetical protein